MSIDLEGQADGVPRAGPALPDDVIVHHDNSVPSQSLSFKEAIGPFRYWRLCAWAGPGFMVTFSIFWGLFGHNIPPYAASLDAAHIAEIFRAHKYSFRVAMTGSMVFTPLYIVWGIAVGKVMETLEGENRILSVLQVWGAGLSGLMVILSCLFWLSAVYRPEELDPKIIELLNDMGWLTINVTFSVTSMQMFAFSVLFLTDTRETPLIPRWLCWYTIGAACSLAAECLLPFFTSGIFSRDGLVNFWLITADFLVFVGFGSFHLQQAIGRLEQQHQASHLVED